MKKMIVALAIVLTGCANTTDPNKVAKATTTSYDPYTKFTAVSADTVRASNPLAGRFFNGFTYHLEADLNNNAENLRLDVESMYDWGVLYAASDIDAVSLAVVPGNNAPAAHPMLEESVAVTFSRSYLESHKTSGLNIRISGQRGAILVKVPGPYVEGFLAKVDATKTQHQVATAK